MIPEILQKKLDYYRFELLLICLITLLFDKILFPDNQFFLDYVWPVNMFLVALAGFTVFRDTTRCFIYYYRNISCIISLLMPFLFKLFYTKYWFLIGLNIHFLNFYGLLFYETLKQIIRRDEVTFSAVLGCVCGYLLLVVIALFCFLFIEVIHPGSFHNISQGNIAYVYNELVYFSFTLITSTGFGDITPINDAARLSSSFFAVIGQFYMVIVMGIILSRFTTNRFN